MEQQKTPINRFVNFATSAEPMVAMDENVFQTVSGLMSSRKRTTVYTKEQAEEVIQSGTPEELRKLSQSFFYTSGFYRRLIIYYSTLLNYTPLLIPHMCGGKKKITDKKYSKKYYDSLELIAALNYEQLCRHFAQVTLVEGAYYGIIKQAEGQYYVQDLPYEYCRSRYRSFTGVDIVEFNLEWFDKIQDQQLKKDTLESFPKEIKKAYRQRSSGNTKGSSWVMIPAEYGVHFSLYDDKPFFGAVIPSIINFNDYVDLEKTKDEQELRSVIVQEMPHTAAGDLVIDPEEAIEFHKGLKKIAQGNSNLDAITTYGEIKLHRVQDNDSSIKNNLEKIERAYYSEAGASKQLFAAEGNISLEKSIQNDISTIYSLACEFGIWLKNFINSLYADKNITFGVEILPVGVYNSKDYLSQALQAAQYGYSFIVPSMAMGLEQGQLLDLKNVEIDLLDMQTNLVPLRSSHTESGNQGDKAKQSQTGAQTDQEKEEAQKKGPSKDETEQSDKTIKNKESSGGEN